MKKTILLLIALVAFSAVYSQSSLNDYKYIIVPKKYDFLKEADQFQVNSLSKFLFQKYKFQAIMEGETLPKDYIKNNCLALKADVLSNSGMFKTKLKVQLKNCNNEVVFETLEGISREKKHKVAYNEALRQAFNSFKNKNYVYNSKSPTVLTSSTDVVDDTKNEIEKLKEEKKQKTTVEKVIDKESSTIAVVKNEQSNATNSSLKAELIQGSILSYNLKDNKGKLVHTILYYGKEDVYIVKGKEALVYKINNNWVIAQYIGDELQVKSIDIKF